MFCSTKATRVPGHVDADNVNPFRNCYLGDRMRPTMGTDECFNRSMYKHKEDHGCDGFGHVCCGLILCAFVK